MSDMASFTEGHVQLRTEIVSEPALLWRWLGDPDAQGWVCLASTVHVLPVPVSQVGLPPLSAELRLGGVSIHIRQFEDAWLVTHVEERSDGVPVRKVTHIYWSTVSADHLGGCSRAEVHAYGALEYRVYWRQPELSSDVRTSTPSIRPWRPWLAAFQGWTSRPQRA